MSDPVYHPSHYQAGRFGLQCIAFSRYMTFNAGNAFKYVWRHQEKGGVQDLKKSLVYLQWCLEDAVPAVLPGCGEYLDALVKKHILPNIREDEAYLALPLVAGSRFDLAQTHLEIIVEAIEEYAAL